MKIEFEDSLINFKILFLKAGKVLEFLIFESKLFHSMTVDGKKRGDLIISSCITCFANGRKYSEEILRRLTFKYFEGVAEFSLPSSFTE